MRETSSRPHFDSHLAPLEATLARGVELLRLQRALDRRHRLVHRAQIAGAPWRGVDRLIGAMLQSLRQAAEHVHGVGEAPMRTKGDGSRLVTRGLPAMRVDIVERDTGR